MSALWIAVFVLAAQPSEGDPQPGAASRPTPAVEQPAVPPRTGAKLREAVRDAQRRWARPSDAEADQAAREFLALFNDLQRDDQLARAQREELRAKVRGRLNALSQQISKRVATEKRLAKSDGPKSVNPPKLSEVLAQWGGAWGQPGGMGGMGAGGMAPGFGGMAPGASGGMGGGAFGSQVADCGDDLVDLIQKTISPHTWDVNGGPGSIYYWRPGRAIVVSAPGEVHENIGGLIDQLQRAGR